MTALDRDLLLLTKRAEADGVKLLVWWSKLGQRVVLSQIIVPKRLRAQGVGSEILKQLTRIADVHCVTVALSPSDSYGATSKARLVRFYKRFGFVENRGRQKNFETTETMYREPEVWACPRG